MSSCIKPKQRLLLFQYFGSFRKILNYQLENNGVIGVRILKAGVEIRSNLMRKYTRITYMFYLNIYGAYFTFG